MRTIDDYADDVGRQARAALAMAAHELRMAGTPMKCLSADWLDRVAEAIDEDALIEVSLTEDGMTVTSPDMRDGLRYVVPAGVAA